MAAIERYFKILLVNIIGIFRPLKKISAANLPVNYFKRILIVKQHDQLGDLLIATPAIRAVRKRFPDAYIGVVVRDYTAPMMWNNPHVDEVVVFHDKLKMWTFKTLRSFFDQLRQKGGYDCAIVLNTVSRSLSSDIIAVLSGAKYIIGPDHIRLDPKSPEKIYDVATHRSDAPQLEIQHDLDIVKATGAVPDGFEYDLDLDSDEQTEGEHTFHSLGLGSSPLTIGVHFGTLDKTRRFPLKKLAEVIDWIKKNYYCEVVIILGPNEAVLREQLTRMIKSTVHVAPIMPIRVAAAFIKHLNLFLCNDTGTLHIASAMRVPTVSFHSTNDPAVWKPPHERHIAVRADNKQIASIRVDAVVEAVKLQLKDFPSLKP